MKLFFPVSLQCDCLRLCMYRNAIVTSSMYAHTYTYTQSHSSDTGSNYFIGDVYLFPCLSISGYWSCYSVIISIFITNNLSKTFLSSWQSAPSVLAPRKVKVPRLGRVYCQTCLICKFIFNILCLSGKGGRIVKKVGQ